MWASNYDLSRVHVKVEEILLYSAFEVTNVITVCLYGVRIKVLNIQICRIKD